MNSLQFDDHRCDFCSNIWSEKSENRSKARPPHLNKSNESPQQLASTTAAQIELELAAAMHAQLQLGPRKDEREPDYKQDHKPPSDMSNGTASTDATAVANVANSVTTFTTPAYTFASRGLTESTLAQQQHELELVSPGDMGGWLAGAAPGYTRLAIAHDNGGWGDRRHTARSNPSQASDASYDFVASPSTEAGQNQDVLAAGTLFDEHSFDPHMYTSRLNI